MLIDINWISGVFGYLLGIFDALAYTLVSVAIFCFNTIARFDLFATGKAAELYGGIVDRIYGILGVVIIFVISYQLLLLVINPDGGVASMSYVDPKKFVKDIIISIVLVMVLPLLYHYMAVFQEHVLTEGTIETVILGIKNTGNTNKQGSRISLMIYMTLFHPSGGGYESVVDADADGNLRVRTPEECVAQAKSTAGRNVESADEDTCEIWVETISDVIDHDFNFFMFLTHFSLFGTIGEKGGSEYFWFLTIIVGFYVAWAFISYCLDLFYRMFRLGFLQIITPIPVMLRILPRQGATFSNWRRTLLNTYLEVFIYVVVISFIILMITNIPNIVGAIWEVVT